MEAPRRVDIGALHPERLTIAALRAHLSSVRAIADSTARLPSSIDARQLLLSVDTANLTRLALVAAPAAIRLRGVLPFQELPVYVFQLHRLSRNQVAIPWALSTQLRFSLIIIGS